jgi:transketolase
MIPRREFERVGSSEIDRDVRLSLLADMCRANALIAVKRAGSGHLGSSFRAMDIVVHLLYEELNTTELGFDHADRDLYFSSKGHDVQGLYAVLHALGVLETSCFASVASRGGVRRHQA